MLDKWHFVLKSPCDNTGKYIVITVVHLLSWVLLFVILQHTRLLWLPLSSWSLLRYLSTESVMLTNLILCRSHLLPSFISSIRVFSNELALHFKWSKYWSFSFRNNPSNEYSRLIPLGLSGVICLQSLGLSRVFSSMTLWKDRFFGTQPTLWPNSHICPWLLEKS